MHRPVRLLLLCSIACTSSLASAQGDSTAAFCFVERVPPAAPLDTAPQWLDSFPAAMRLAEQEDKQVLLYFSAVW